ncbi:MAG: hypothetical protein OXC40_04700 [Proteobacteria bacterium]|nr:hypothetical protein [Pseudomonadota bacterium]
MLWACSLVLPTPVELGEGYQEIASKRHKHYLQSPGYWCQQE